MFTLAIPCFDGIYLPKEESQFLHQVMDDLETYQQENDHNIVLLFPPFPSRLRYLIHKTVEAMPELTTFSVGESWCRQVVVCPYELRGESDEDSSSESNDCFSEEPLSRKEEVLVSIKPKRPAPSQSRGPKRPDKPLYMPRAMRERRSLQNPPGPTANQDLESSAFCSSNSVSGPSDSCSCTETTQHSSSSLQTCSKVVQSKTDNCANSSGPCLQEKTLTSSLKLQENEALLWDQAQPYFSDMTLDDDKSEDLAFGPDGVQTEDTSSETEYLTKQIRAHLKETDTISIKLVHNDYSVYENVSLNSDDFGHVIEIYNFPAIFKTDDLLDAFSEYSDGGMKIKWVDNTHALGVFSSEAAALQALSINHPLLKTRAMSEGSKKAKGKALRRAEFLQPVKERPRTDCAVAKRMVTRALGIRGRGRLQRY